MPRRSVFTRRNLGWWGFFKSIVADKHTWLSIVYMVLQLPLGITYFTALITLVSLSLYGIALPILQLGYDLPVYVNYGAAYYLPGWALPLTVIGGILLATLTMHLVRYIGRLHGALAKAMLVKT